VAKENGGTILFTLLPHISHTLQPLFCTIFGPYKTYYNACLHDWMLSNPGKPVTIYSVADIIAKSSSKAFTEHNIEVEFHGTGIYP
jgi:hypothetical protein